MADNFSSDSDAGPIVQTIFVLLSILVAYQIKLIKKNFGTNKPMNFQLSITNFQITTLF